MVFHQCGYIPGVAPSSYKDVSHIGLGSHSEIQNLTIPIAGEGQSSNSPHSLLLEINDTGTLEIIWRFLIKLSIIFPCDSAILLLGIYPTNMKTMSTQKPTYKCLQQCYA
jgi:hypothetical protein